MTHTATPESASAGAARIGGPGAVLDDEQIRGFVRDQLAAVPLDGRSVCVIVPDGTRSCPLPLLLSARPRRAARPRHPAHRARRARHPRRDGASRRWPGTWATRAAGSPSTIPACPCAITNGGTRTRS